MRHGLLPALFLMLLASLAPSDSIAGAPEPPHFDRDSAEQIDQGKRVLAVLGCSGCHTAKLTGLDGSQPGFRRKSDRLSAR